MGNVIIIYEYSNDDRHALDHELDLKRLQNTKKIKLYFASSKSMQQIAFASLIILFAIEDGTMHAKLWNAMKSHLMVYLFLLLIQCVYAFTSFY